MRDPLDHSTAELPAIPPPPVKPARLTEAQRRQACGFEGPKARPGCASCRHVEQTYRRPDSPTEAEEWRCRRHGFPVQRMAICRDWLAR